MEAAGFLCFVRFVAKLSSQVIDLSHGKRKATMEHEDEPAKTCIVIKLFLTSSVCVCALFLLRLASMHSSEVTKLDVLK